MQVIGDYTLNVAFGEQGENIVVLAPQLIHEFTITQDIEYLLPTFKMVLHDSTGQWGNVVPFDKRINNIQIGITSSLDTSKINTFKFLVKRRKVKAGNYYDTEGLLNVPKLITDQWCRAFDGNVAGSIWTIAANDLGIEADIGASLAFDKILVQPQWTNALFLRYLADQLEGKSGEGGYYCFIKNTGSIPTLVFKSLNELLYNDIRRKFIISPQQYMDFLPVFNYQIHDNSQILIDLGSEDQKYTYFDYNTGAYVTSSKDIDSIPTLSSLHYIDKDRQTGSQTVWKNGRSNDFSGDFTGKINNIYFKRTSELVQMWITTLGLEDVAPGDLVHVIFGDQFKQDGAMNSYQHSGIWLIKRVVHNIGSTFTTNLLLIRSGCETDVSNSLTQAKSQVKKL